MAEGPRERMMTFGSASLSDAELLSMVLSGSDAVARGVLGAVGAPQGLLSKRLAELAALPGMTAAKAERLMAAVELGRRAGLPSELGASMSTSSAIAAHCARYASEPTESFIAISLDSRNRVKGEWVVAKGWESGVNVTPRQVFTLLVKENAGRVIFVHNHPSGDSAPSAEDIRFTKRLIDAAKLLDIKVLDHIVVASGGYTSIRETHGYEAGFEG